MSSPGVSGARALLLLLPPPWHWDLLPDPSCPHPSHTLALLHWPILSLPSGFQWGVIGTAREGLLTGEWRKQQGLSRALVVLEVLGEWPR